MISEDAILLILKIWRLQKMAKNITDATFAKETDKGLVLIDFWATWCGPCRMQAPILEQLAESYDEDEFKIVKMDVDENPETPASFGVMSIPTLILKKDGQVVDKAIGVQTKEQIEAMIAPHK
jgi:thioredoxin 1